MLSSALKKPSSYPMSKIEDQKNQDMSNSPDNLSRSTSFVDDRASVGSHDPEDQEIDHRFSVEIPTGDEVIPGKKPKISQMELAPEEDSDAENATDSGGDEPKSLSRRIHEYMFPKKPPKFGTFTGVFARCLLNIWGVIMFLRLGWMIAHAGLLLSISIVCVAMFITTITTLSLSAICTNGIIGGGGAYFLLSRSLGPAFGGSIGVLFSLANATAVALHLVGFAETITSPLSKVESDFTFTDGMGDGLWDLRIYAVLCLIFLIGVGLVGVSYVVKLQLNFLWLLCISLICYFVGTFYSADPSYAFTGYNSTTLSDNMSPDFQSGETWITLFAVFFPASTGIMAGANISGDLKDAQRSIPKGTLWAVGVSGVTYIFMLISIAATVERGTNRNGDGSPGLYNDYLVMYDMSAWPVSVVIGIVASALSSALAALVGAPRVFQAVCEDGLFPAVSFLGKTTVVASGSPEPLRLYGVTFVIAVCVILIGDLSAIAPYMTNFFMISYALINYAAFIACHDNSPGWRPKWKHYNKWLALFGSFCCVGAMVMISWYTGIVTLMIAFLLYKYVDYSPINKNWGNIHKSIQYNSAVTNVYKLEKSYRQSTVHVKNYRPAYLVMSGPIRARDDFVRFVQQLRYGKGIAIAANVILGDFESERDRLRQEKALNFYSMNKFSVVPMAVCAKTLLEGARTLLQSAGVGVLSPNTVVLNFKMLSEEDDTKTKKHNMSNRYSHPRRRRSREVIPIHELPDQAEGEITSRLARHLRKAGLIRGGGLPGTGGLLGEDELDCLENEEKVSDKVMSPLDIKVDTSAELEQDSKKQSSSPSRIVRKGSYSPRSPSRIKRGTDSYTGKGTFARLPGIWRKALTTPESRTGRVDVYWLCDHGGLVLLIPHLLRKNPTWRNLKLRILVPCTKEYKNNFTDGIERQCNALRRVLRELRIESECDILPRCPELDVFFVSVEDSKTLDGFYEKQNTLGSSVFKSPKKNKESSSDVESGDDNAVSFKDIVAKKSKDATMIFISAPHPDTKRPTKYLKMLDRWSSEVDHVPTFYVHGNGERVFSIEA